MADDTQTTIQPWWWLPVTRGDVVTVFVVWELLNIVTITVKHFL